MCSPIVCALECLYAEMSVFGRSGAGSGSEERCLGSGLGSGPGSGSASLEKINSNE